MATANQTEVAQSLLQRLDNFLSGIADAMKNSGGPFWWWLATVIVVAWFLKFYLPLLPVPFVYVICIAVILFTGYVADDLAKNLLPFGLVPISQLSIRPRPEPPDPRGFPFDLLIALLLIGLLAMTYNETWRSNPWDWFTVDWDRKIIKEIIDPITGYMAAAGGFIEIARVYAFIDAKIPDKRLRIYERLAKDLVAGSFLFQAGMIFLPLLLTDLWEWFDRFHWLPLVMAGLVLGLLGLLFWLHRKSPD